MPAASFVRCPNAYKKATGTVVLVSGIKGVKGTTKCTVCNKAIRVDTSGRFLDHRLK